MLMEKINHFAALLESDQIHDLIGRNLSCDANITNAKVYVRPGKKYVKVDIGGSGRYMVDEEGNIYGIKGYGVIHRGHRFGTVDTVGQYYWGRYYFAKRTESHPTELLTVESVLESRQQTEPLNIITVDFISRRKIS